MPTVAEMLEASGLTKEQIAALDARVLNTFNGVLTTAEQEKKTAVEAAKKAEEERVAAKSAQDAAELAKRSTSELWEQTNASLTMWEEKEKQAQQELANAKARAAFFETQVKSIKDSGISTADLPEFVPPAVAPPAVRDPQGRFVAGAPGSTPGSPTFTMEQVRDGIGSTMGTISDIQWKYQSLHGGHPMPMAPTELVRQAESQKMDPSAYAAKIFNFAQKEQEAAEKAKQEEKAKWLAEATAPLQEQIKQKDIEWQKKLEEAKLAVAERGGNNPDVRRAAVSNYPEIKKAVEEGTRKDPLTMTREQRQVEMRRQIQADVLANEEAKQSAVA